MSYDVTTMMASSPNDSFTGGNDTVEGCPILRAPKVDRSSSGQDLSNELFKALSEAGAAVISAICLIGFPTNILNMLVFFRQGLGTNIIVCMFTQSVADFAILLTYFCWNFDTFYALITGAPKKLVWLKFLINNYLSICIAFMYVSSFMSMTIAMERCLVVLKPLRSKSQRGSRLLVAVIVLVHLLLLSVHFIVSAGIQVACVYNPMTNTTYDILTDSAFRLNNIQFVDAVNGALFGMIIPGTCLLGTTLSTFITVVQLRKRSAWRLEASSSGGQLSARDAALTKVLVVVSFVYIFCSIPRMAGRFSLLLDDTLSPGSARKNTFQMLIMTQQIFTCLNSSLNFFVYWALGSRFRSTLASLLPCCRGRRPGGVGPKEVAPRQQVKVSHLTHPTSSDLSSADTAPSTLGLNEY